MRLSGFTCVSASGFARLHLVLSGILTDSKQIPCDKRNCALIGCYMCFCRVESGPMGDSNGF